MLNNSKLNQEHSESEDTIVALTTPRGRGAIAMVRISGDRAIDVAAHLVKDPQRLRRQKTHQLHLVDLLLEDGSLLDRPLCAVFCAPHSYTGEDVVEFFLHGGTYIAAKVIELCCQKGARVARPGEFTLRAFLHGRLDLAQAEAVADLVAAEGAAAHRTAIEQRQGALSRRIRDLRHRLIEIYSLVELDIDFSDQDLPVINRNQTLLLLREVEGDLRRLEASFIRGRLAREGAAVAIAGAPNVGKSTLFNALLEEDRAIVHETPGTTRDAVEGLVEWEGLTIRLIDTAGQADRFTGPDQEAVLRARRAAEAADITLWLLDLSDPHPQLPPADLAGRTIVIGNKVDLVKDEEPRFNIEYLRISALKGTGLTEVKQAILLKLSPKSETEIGEGILTRERHLDAVRRGLKSIGDAKHILQENLGEELLAADLRDAVNHLGEIIGEITPDDVLNRIFSEFCIGK